MKSKIFSATFLGIGFLVGATALSALAQWTAAPAGGPPPAVCPTSIPGCNAPINEGGIGQIKAGSLTVGGLGILGDFTFLPVGGTPPTLGQVLMADATGLSLGKVKWGDVAAGGGSSQNIQHGFSANTGASTNHVTFNPPFPTIPHVVISRNYFDEDEEMQIVRNVSVNGFDIVGNAVNWTKSNHSLGASDADASVPYGFYWMAIANSSSLPALTAGNIACTRTGTTYYFSGAPTGGAGSYSYRLHMWGWNQLLSKSISIPGSYNYGNDAAEQLQVEYNGSQVFIRVTSSTETVDISCPRG